MQPKPVLIHINLCCQHWQGANTTTVFDINQVYIMLVPLAFLKLLVSSESGWYQEQFQKKRSEMLLSSRTSVLVATSTGNVTTRMKNEDVTQSNSRFVERKWSKMSIGTF